MFGKPPRGAVIVSLALSIIVFGHPVIAQPVASPIGDWHGTMRSGERQTRSAIRIQESAPGVLTGDIDLPDTGQWNVPLESVTLKDGVFAFSYRQGTRKFEGRWDGAANAWVGQFQNPSGVLQVVYQAGFLGLPVLQGLDGFWEADAAIQGYHRSFKLRVTTDAHGTHALMDIPELVQTDVGVTSLSRNGEKIGFEIASLGMKFSGSLGAQAGSIAGGIEAGGTTSPVVFVRNERGPPRRIQTPAPPYPYTLEDLVIPNPASPGTSLGCTLNIPKTGGLHPAAVLLNGSGQQDRDETLVGHKPFLVLADHLARNGIAVLRCDDRGVGASTGDYRGATLADFAGDAGVGLDFLKARRDIDSRKIGLIGHSEGGLVAALAAGLRPDVAFVIQMAGPGVPIYDLLLTQGEEVMRGQGIPEARILEQRPLRRAVLSAMRDAGPEAARGAVEAVLIAFGASPENARAQASQEASPDILRIVKADPATSLANLRAPVLAMVGSKDRQVSPEPNLAALRKALATHPDAEIRELPGLNHLFQTAETGAPGEYYNIEETISPAALNYMTDWLTAHISSTSVRHVATAQGPTRTQ